MIYFINKMDKIPDQYIDTDIYKKAKEIADEKYTDHSAYKSMFLGK